MINLPLGRADFDLGNGVVKADDLCELYDLIVKYEKEVGTDQLDESHAPEIAARLSARWGVTVTPAQALIAREHVITEWLGLLRRSLPAGQVGTPVPATEPVGDE